MAEFMVWLLVYTGMIICGSGRKQAESGLKYLSTESTGALKGIAAGFIVLHHLSKDVVTGGPLRIMQYIGILMVALFYFVSGYGLSYGLTNKENYLRDFLHKRLTAVMVPYWILLTAKVVADALCGKVYPVPKLFLSYIGFEYITNTWFIISIIVIYLAFYVAFRFGEALCLDYHVSIIILAIELSAYIIICMAAGMPSCYTASVVAFPMGIFWHKKEDVILGFILKRYWKFLMFFGSLAVFGFFGRLALSYAGWDNEILHTLLRNMVCFFFVAVSVVILMKLDLGGIGTLLGKISLEIYISHSVLLELLRPVMKDSPGYCSLVIFGSGGAALLTHWLAGKFFSRND